MDTTILSPLISLGCGPMPMMSSASAWLDDAAELRATILSSELQADYLAIALAL